MLPVTRATSIDSGMPVDEIMRRWPATIRVMLRHKMLCVGCPIGIFHNVAEVCSVHGIDKKNFLAELSAAIGNDPQTNTTSVVEVCSGTLVNPANACLGSVTSGGDSPLPASMHVDR